MPDITRDTVVLLHGIARTRRSLFRIERALRREGFDARGITYPSLRHDLAELAGFLAETMTREGIWQRSGKVHFVTHSMGGLVLRRYLATRRDAIPANRLGRVVMLGPPNRGSEVADRLKDLPPYRWFYGPAGQELTTEARMAPDAAPYYELGIVAGSGGWPYSVAGRLLPAPHDGRVSVARTTVPGMADHVVLPAMHSVMLWNPEVHRQIVHFLKHGRFSRNP